MEQNNRKAIKIQRKIDCIILPKLKLKLVWM